MKIFEHFIPREYLNYAEIKKLEPQQDCEVSIFNKETKQYQKKIIYRKYKSFGLSPSFKETGKSFMFNNQTNDIPKELECYLSFAKLLDKAYNNCYVNWYDSGENYIEPHSDCNDQIIDGSLIIIINLNEGQYERTFKIQHKDGGEIQQIKLKHGHCLMFDSK